MQQVGNLTEEIRERIKRIRANRDTTSNTESSSDYECPKCKDTGYIIDGWTASECLCMKQKRLNLRMKNAMIPQEFENAKFDTYKVNNPTQRKMLNAIKQYLSEFEENKETSFGFIAIFGEKRLREIKNPQQRAEMKRQHNNFGLGKTHLQIAAAKHLIKYGYTVLCISDVTFMEELGQARAVNDEGEEFNQLLWSVSNADILVWDDIGKAKTTDFRQGMYYRIIDERYKARKPIIYSSNEDQETLSEKIGDAAASRLFGMSKRETEDGHEKSFVFAVEGPDYRLTGGKVNVPNMQ